MTPSALLSTFFSVGCLAALATGLAVQNASALTLCQHLEDTLGSTLFTQSEIGYEALRTHHWAESAWAFPTCISRPATTRELQMVVEQLVETNISFAVRSGGHSPHLGASSITNGVLIDLSNFNHLAYDAEDGTVVIGTGLRWGEVYAGLDEYQVTVVGGRVADVGVGGLTLGGGLSWLSNLHGLVADNVVNFEVVLAHGSVVNANAQENTDLFWALKGGGNNFGIVTAFTFPTHPIHQVWGGFRTHTIEDLPVLMDAFFEYQSVSEKDPYANMMILASPTNDTVGILLTLVYLKPEERPAIFESFYRINSTADLTSLQTLTEFIVSNPLPNMTTQFDWSATSLKPNKGLYQNLTKSILESPAVDSIRSVTAGFMGASLQPISSSVVKAGRARGGNPLGLEAVDQTWAQFNSAWWWDEDDLTVHVAQQELVGEFENASIAQDSYVPYLFMNDASWDQQVIARYGKENVQKLRQVQQKYDPDQVFQRLVPGYFKLP